MTVTSTATFTTQDACQSDGYARLLEAFRLLQQARTVSEVFDAAASALPVLGFHRSLVARLVGDQWEPVFSGDPAHIAWTPPGWSWPQAAHPAAPHGAQVAQLYPRTTLSSRPVSEHAWATATVAPDGSVVGMLFADQPIALGGVNDENRDLLTLFAEGMGYVLQRAELAERIALLRDALNEPGLSCRGTAPRRDKADARPATGHTRTPAVIDRGDRIENPLTRRERDIMELVARGDTNTQIARRLVLSEGTVKWHMKNILRKLGAPNRAAAVSAWLLENAG